MAVEVGREGGIYSCCVPVFWLVVIALLQWGESLLISPFLTAHSGGQTDGQTDSRLTG